jgi:uncharacterized protein YbjQ (UPF0145 family)
MILSTTPTLQTHRITRYLGIVTGEAILGANIFRDLFAQVRDIVGGRSAAYEQELARARKTALAELEEAAAALGAGAVVGIDLDYEVINNMLMVTASGTAVDVEAA